MSEDALPALRRVDDDPGGAAEVSESSSLLDKKTSVDYDEQSSVFNSRRKGRNSRRLIQTCAAVVLALAFIAIGILWKKRTSSSSSTVTDYDDDGSDSLTISDFYIERDGASATK